MQKKIVWKKRLFYLFMVLTVLTIIGDIPLPWMNPEYLKELVNTNAGLGLLDSLTGNAFSTMSVTALSITPYITVSIVLQLMENVIPRLAEIRKDGASGKRYMKKITLIGTCIMALAEASFIAYRFSESGYFRKSGALYVILTAVVWTLGSISIAFLGEWIDKHLFEGGTSIILAANIISGLPSDAGLLYDVFKNIKLWPLALVGTIACCLLMVFYVLELDSGAYMIQTRHSGKISNKQNGVKDQLPLKVNLGGVAPVIFAATLFSVLAMIAQFSSNKVVQGIFGIFNTGNWFGLPWYNNIGLILYIGCIFYFSFFYAKMVFDPKKMAMNLKSTGASIVAVRPGKDTEVYLTRKLKAMTILGGIGISVIAVLPTLISAILNVSKLSFFGTSMLIVVGILHSLQQQIHAETIYAKKINSLT